MTNPYADLPPVVFDYDAEDPNDPALCMRCGGLVHQTVGARVAHERWHEAVESAGASAPTQTEQFAPLRDQLIQHLTAGPAHRDEEACVDYLMPLIEDWAGRYLSRATTAEATSFQAIGLKRDLEMMTARYQREADRIADYERETREAHQKADDLEMALRRVEERTRTDLAEARAEVERSRAAIQRANDLVDELRKHVETRDTVTQQRQAELAGVLDCAAQTSWRQLLAYVRALVHGPAEGELRRLRRVEDALVELGAPGSSTGDDPAGPMIAWIRDKVEQLEGADQREAALIAVNKQLIAQRGEPPFGLREQLLDALQVEDTGQDVVELVRKQAIELAAHRGIQQGQVSPTVAGIVDAQHVALLRLAAKGRHAYAEGPLSETAKHLRHEAATFEVAARLIEDPRSLAGLIPTSMQTWSLDDDVSEMLVKATGIRVVLLDSQPESAADPAPSVDALDGQRAGFIALLEMAARGREAYAKDASTTRKMQLHHEAMAFRNAADLVKDPTRLDSFVPASVLAEGISDPAVEPPDHMSGVVNVRALNDIDDVWMCVRCSRRTGMMGHPNGCPPGTATISTRDDGSFSPPADADEDAEELTDQQLSDLLLLVGVTPSAAQLASWTPEQREQAAHWAGLVHLDASDNDVDVPERPAFLDEPAAVPCQSKFLYQPDGKPERLLWCGKTVPHDEDHYHFLSPGHGVRWTSANQAGLIHLGDSGADPESRRETGWRCDACSHPNTDDVETCEACEATRREPAAAELCPSLYLTATRQLVACQQPKMDEPDLHSAIVDGQYIAWREPNEVPVPWPLDQEPPPGIDVLRDTDAEPNATYLVRLPDGTWEWFDDPNDRSGPRVSNDWATAVLDADGDLHVVRP